MFYKLISVPALRVCVLIKTSPRSSLRMIMSYVHPRYRHVSSSQGFCTKNSAWIFKKKKKNEWWEIHNLLLLDCVETFCVLCNLVFHEARSIAGVCIFCVVPWSLLPVLDTAILSLLACVKRLLVVQWLALLDVSFTLARVSHGFNSDATVSSVRFDLVQYNGHSW